MKQKTLASLASLLLFCPPIGSQNCGAPECAYATLVRALGRRPVGGRRAALARAAPRAICR
jgi:hypothetical protein